MVFINDIRRGNLHMQLMYKALFELSADRSEFMSRLFTKAKPASVTASSTAGELSEAYWLADTIVENNNARYNANLKALHRSPDENAQAAARQRRRRGISNVYYQFYYHGPKITYSSSSTSNPNAITTMPTYGDLIMATDGQGIFRGYLASEATFKIMKDLESRNLVIPVVGDFAGPKALRAIGALGPRSRRDRHRVLPLERRAVPAAERRLAQLLRERRQHAAHRREHVHPIGQQQRRRRRRGSSIRSARCRPKRQDAAEHSPDDLTDATTEGTSQCSSPIPPCGYVCVRRSCWRSPSRSSGRARAGVRRPAPGSHRRRGVLAPREPSSPNPAVISDRTISSRTKSCSPASSRRSRARAKARRRLPRRRARAELHLHRRDSRRGSRSSSTSAAATCTCSCSTRRCSSCRRSRAEFVGRLFNREGLGAARHGRVGARICSRRRSRRPSRADAVYRSRLADVREWLLDACTGLPLSAADLEGIVIDLRGAAPLRADDHLALVRQRAIGRPGRRTPSS